MVDLLVLILLLRCFGCFDVGGFVVFVCLRFRLFSLRAIVLIIGVTWGCTF